MTTWQEYNTQNERAPAQWRAIKDLDFTGTVVDFGCGYSDILFRIAQLGSTQRLVGVDINPSIIFRNEGISELNDFGIEFYNANIESMMEEWEDPIDTAICFSVLPYLENPNYAMDWFSRSAGRTLIECQYASDGPGFEGIKDDDDMAAWIGMFWDDYRPIGATIVEYRNVHRTIWLCEQ